MIVTKKHIVYSILALAVVVLVTVVGALVLRTAVKPTPQAITPSSKPDVPNILTTEKEATDSIAKAKEARTKNDFTAAISSYQKARTYYESTNNVEKIADIDLAISLLESEKKNVPPAVKPALAGEK